MTELGTVLMPTYAIASWYGLYAYGSSGKYILPVAFIGWIWAIVNIARTKRVDLGVVTFLFVILAALFERQYGFTRGAKLALTAASVVVAGNYSLVLTFWKEVSKALSAKKSQTWMNIYLSYAILMLVFWLCAAAKTYLRGENEYTVVGGS